MISYYSVQRGRCGQMEKKTGMAMYFLLACTFLLGGCSNSQPEAEAITAIEEAAEKNASLENGRFETDSTLKNEVEEITQEAEGAFTRKTGEEYDWYYKVIFGGEGGSTMSELMEMDGEQFQRVSIVSQSVSEWVEMPEQESTLKDYVGLLFENELTESEIDELEVNGKEDGTKYKITLNEKYSERVQAESIKEIQQVIEELKQSDTEEAIIQSLETQLEYIEKTSYQDNHISFEVNSDGYLTSASFQTTVLPPDEASYTVINTSNLTEYNNESIQELFLQLQND